MNSQPDLNWIFKFIAPSLAGLVIFMYGAKFLEDPSTNAIWFKLAGILIPVAFLTSIGVDGLVKNGGFIMQLLGVKPRFINIVVYGLVWIFLGLIVGYLYTSRVMDPYLKNVLYGVFHACFTAGCGIFVMLAWHKSSETISSTRPEIITKNKKD